jgi:hypothetical protein
MLNSWLILLLIFTTALSMVAILKGMWLKFKYTDALNKIFQMQIDSTTTNAFL